MSHAMRIGTKHNLSQKIKHTQQKQQISLIKQSYISFIGVYKITDLKYAIQNSTLTKLNQNGPTRSSTWACGIDKMLFGFAPVVFFGIEGTHLTDF